MCLVRHSGLQSASVLELPQTMDSRSPPPQLAWQNGANDEIGKIELKPFLNAETCSFTVSWKEERSHGIGDGVPQKNEW